MPGVNSSPTIGLTQSLPMAVDEQVDFFAAQRAEAPLPDVVTDRLEDMSPASTAVRHAVDCGRCSQAWDRFAEFKAILNG